MRRVAYAELYLNDQQISGSMPFLWTKKRFRVKIGHVRVLRPDNTRFDPQYVFQHRRSGRFLSTSLHRCRVWDRELFGESTET